MNLEIDYDAIERKTSKEFVNLIKDQLTGNVEWKYFSVNESAEFFSVDAVDCFIGNPDMTHSAYHFLFSFDDRTFLKQELNTLWISKMLERGWEFR